MGPDDKELSFLHSSAERIIFCPIWAKTHTSNKCDDEPKDNGGGKSARPAIQIYSPTTKSHTGRTQARHYLRSREVDYTGGCLAATPSFLFRR